MCSGGRDILRPDWFSLRRLRFMNVDAGSMMDIKPQVPLRHDQLSLNWTSVNSGVVSIG